jgi:hypothetical protein
VVSGTAAIVMAPLIQNGFLTEESLERKPVHTVSSFWSIRHVTYMASVTRAWDGKCLRASSVSGFHWSSGLRTSSQTILAARRCRQEKSRVALQSTMPLTMPLDYGKLNVLENIVICERHSDGLCMGAMETTTL